MLKQNEMKEASINADPKLLKNMRLKKQTLGKEVYYKHDDGRCAPSAPLELQGIGQLSKGSIGIMNTMFTRIEHPAYTINRNTEQRKKEMGEQLEEQRRLKYEKEARILDKTVQEAHAKEGLRLAIRAIKRADDTK